MIHNLNLDYDSIYLNERKTAVHAFLPAVSSVYLLVLTDLVSVKLFLELVRIWKGIQLVVLQPTTLQQASNSLSELAKRMAIVSCRDSPSDMSAATVQTHERSEPTLGAKSISGVTGSSYQGKPHVISKQQIQYNCWILTQVICANLESLVASHQQANSASFLVLQKTHISGTAFLPFTEALVESK